MSPPPGMAQLWNRRNRSGKSVSPDRRGSPAALRMQRQRRDERRDGRKRNKLIRHAASVNDPPAAASQICARSRGLQLCPPEKIREHGGHFGLLAVLRRNEIDVEVAGE